MGRLVIWTASPGTCSIKLPRLPLVQQIMVEGLGGGGAVGVGKIWDKEGDGCIHSEGGMMQGKCLPVSLAWATMMWSGGMYYQKCKVKTSLSPSLSCFLFPLPLAPLLCDLHSPITCGLKQQPHDPW